MNDFCSHLGKNMQKDKERFGKLDRSIQETIIDYSRKLMESAEIRLKYQSIFKRAVYIFQLNQVVNVNVKSIRPKYKDFAEWNKDPQNVYIGRNVFYVNAPLSKWHNPFPAKKYGREESIRKFKEYMTNKLENDPQLQKELLQLRSKKLGCWCKPEACHGDVLIELINKYLNK